MAKLWKQVEEGVFSGYTVKDVDNITLKVATILNNRADDIRTEDYNFMADEGIHYFRAAVATGKFVVDLTVVEKAKTTEQLHEVITEIKELGRLSPEYKKDQEKKKQSSND